jgi:hypothetical protein
VAGLLLELHNQIFERGADAAGRDQRDLGRMRGARAEKCHCRGRRQNHVPHWNPSSLGGTRSRARAVRVSCADGRHHNGGAR